MSMAEAIVADAAAIAAVKTYLRIGDDGEDAAIAALIAAAIGYCEQFTGQMLVTRVIEEQARAVSGWQRLSRGPVSTVSGVVGRMGAGAPFTLPVEAYAIDIDAAGDGWVRIGSTGAATRVTVTYSAGMATTWSGLPEPLRQGVIRLASHLYAHRDAPDEGPPPAAVAALWRPWRRMRLV